MAVTVDRPRTRAELTEFVRFADEVNGAASTAWWPAVVPLQVPFLMGRGPGSEDRTVLPLLARDGDRVVARVAAVVDRSYIDHWDEPLGHVVMFEAVAGAVAGTRAVMDEACAWLRGHGLHAARCGTGPGHDLGFVVDAYDELPAMLVRQNPPYYHALLKEAGFATEKAWIDYRAEAGPENVARWEALAATVPAGHRVVTLAEVPAERRLADFTAVWNDAFRSHWGMAPTPVAELEAAAGWAGATGMIEHSLLAYRGDEAVGAVWTNPELSRLARLAPGRQLAPAERLNFLGVGVREHARGHGLGRALVARSYLDLHRAGATHVGYTMVLDDNWPSRRTAESLHATVRANYLVYRRDLG